MDYIRNSFWIFLSIITLIDSAPPTLEELTALQCNSERPFKCLPYGVCYNADEFCVAGDVESCFPKNITTDQLENWCKTTGQFRPELMRDPKLCALACQARFPSLNLSNALEKQANKTCSLESDLKCLPDGICHGLDEYCHHGVVTSCFNETMLEEEQLQWCIDKVVINVTSMPNKACQFACHSKHPNLFSAALDQLVNKSCPQERPCKCLLDGVCHGYDEFCDAGRNKSCFDESMSENELMQWCRDIKPNDVRVYPQLSCIHACHARFHSLSSKGGENGIWLYLFIGLAVLVLVTAAAGVLVWIKRHQIRSTCSRFGWCQQETENPTPEREGGETEENNDDKRNSTGSDIEIGPAQTLNTVTRDNERRSDEPNSSAKDPLLPVDLREGVPKPKIQKEEEIIELMTSK